MMHNSSNNNGENEILPPQPTLSVGHPDDDIELGDVKVVEQHHSQQQPQQEHHNQQPQKIELTIDTTGTDNAPVHEQQNLNNDKNNGNISSATAVVVHNNNSIVNYNNNTDNYNNYNNNNYNTSTPDVDYYDDNNSYIATNTDMMAANENNNNDTINNDNNNTSGNNNSIQEASVKSPANGTLSALGECWKFLYRILFQYIILGEMNWLAFALDRTSERLWKLAVTPSALPFLAIATTTSLSKLTAAVATGNNNNNKDGLTKKFDDDEETISSVASSAIALNNNNSNNNNNNQQAATTTRKNLAPSSEPQTASWAPREGSATTTVPIVASLCYLLLRLVALMLYVLVEIIIFFDAVFRGIAQVVFVNNPIAYVVCYGLPKRVYMCFLAPFYCLNFFLALTKTT